MQSQRAGWYTTDQINRAIGQSWRINKLAEERQSKKKNQEKDIQPKVWPIIKNIEILLILSGKKFIISHVFFKRVWFCHSAIRYRDIVLLRIYGPRWLGICTEYNNES